MHQQIIAIMPVASSCCRGYLHAIKDYTDMAFHLEQHPQVKVTVNFVPVLLDQLKITNSSSPPARYRPAVAIVGAREPQ